MKNDLFIKNVKREDGFTLVELALVLIIFGMVMSTAMLGLQRYTGGLTFQRTMDAIDQSERALFLFQISEGKYPCPADPTLGPGDPLYGIADCNSPNLFTVTGRDIDNADGDDDPRTDGDLLVLIGALPFATFDDPDGNPATDDAPYPEYRATHALDGWGSKLTYAVTLDLTDHPAAPADFDHERGGIFIVDEFNRDVTDQPGIAHAVILSHGPNAKGAHSEQGRPIDDCVDIVVPADVDAANVKIPKDERENCDFEEAAIADAIFLNGVRNYTSGDYNDDILRFMVSNVSELWTYTNAIFSDNGTPGDPSDDFFINQVTNTNGGNIGIGVDTPQAQLHLEGNIQAFEMHVEGLCDTAGGDCLPPEYIGGEVADMQCPDGQVVTKIGRTDPANTTPEVVCENPFPPTAFGNCPPGTLLTGLSNTNGPICTAP